MVTASEAAGIAFGHKAKLEARIWDKCWDAIGAAAKVGKWSTELQAIATSADAHCARGLLLAGGYDVEMFESDAAGIIVKGAPEGGDVLMHVPASGEAVWCVRIDWQP